MKAAVDESIEADGGYRSAAEVTPIRELDGRSIGSGSRGPITEKLQSQYFDLVLTNRFVGFPIFIFFIWAMFQLTFSLGAYPMEWIDMGVNFVSKILAHVLPNNLFKDFLLDEKTLKRPYLNAKTVEKIVGDHTKGIGNYTNEISKLITL